MEMAREMQLPLSCILCLQRIQTREGSITMALLKTSQKGLKSGWTRATFILRNDYLEKIKASAYWERKSVKEVIDEALGSYLKGKRIKSKRNP